MQIVFKIEFQLNTGYIKEKFNNKYKEYTIDADNYS